MEGGLTYIYRWRFGVSLFFCVSTHSLRFFYSLLFYQKLLLPWRLDVSCGTTCYACLLRFNILYRALDLGMIVRVFLLFLCPTFRPPWIEHSVMG